MGLKNLKAKVVVYHRLSSYVNVPSLHVEVEVIGLTMAWLVKGTADFGDRATAAFDPSMETLLLCVVKGDVRDE